MGIKGRILKHLQETIGLDAIKKYKFNRADQGQGHHWTTTHIGHWKLKLEKFKFDEDSRLQVSTSLCTLEKTASTLTEQWNNAGEDLSDGEEERGEGASLRFLGKTNAATAKFKKFQ